MAASEYLRQGGLLDAVRSHFTPDVVRSASRFLGESETSTRTALNAASPTILSGLTNIASTREGAGALTNMIRDGGFGSAAENAGSLFAGGSGTSGMLSAGQQLVGKIFGGRSSAVTDLVAKTGGVSGSSAGKLMALASPLILGVLGKRAAEQHLDSAGLANTLMNERSEFANAAPAGLGKLLSAGPAAVSRTPDVEAAPPASTLRTYTEPNVETVRAAPPRAGGGMKWLPLLLVALAVLGLLMLLRGRRPDVTGTAAEGVNAARGALSKLTLPGGANIDVAPGTLNYNLAQFLGDSGTPAPKTFVFDNLNFETGGTNLTPESAPTVSNLAAILKAYPNAQVQLNGYTDNTGSPDANRTLSQNRADAIKSQLVNQGVDAGRISTQGFGQDNPVASNDTDEGRARNRRIELTVTSK